MDEHLESTFQRVCGRRARRLENGSGRNRSRHWARGQGRELLWAGLVPACPGSISRRMADVPDGCVPQELAARHGRDESSRAPVGAFSMAGSWPRPFRPGAGACGVSEPRGDARSGRPLARVLRHPGVFRLVRRGTNRARRRRSDDRVPGRMAGLARGGPASCRARVGGHAEVRRLSPWEYRQQSQLLDHRALHGSFRRTSGAVIARAVIMLLYARARRRQAAQHALEQELAAPRWGEGHLRCRHQSNQSRSGQGMDHGATGS